MYCSICNCSDSIRVHSHIQAASCRWSSTVNEILNFCNITSLLHCSICPCHECWQAIVLSYPEDCYWSAKIVPLLLLMRNIAVLLLHTDLAMAMRCLTCKAIRKLASNASVMPVNIPTQMCFWYSSKVCSPCNLVFSTCIASLLYTSPWQNSQNHCIRKLVISYCTRVALLNQFET